jgi:hypothetical protein
MPPPEVITSRSVLSVAQFGPLEIQAIVRLQRQLSALHPGQLPRWFTGLTLYEEHEKDPSAWSLGSMIPLMFRRLGGQTCEQPAPEKTSLRLVLSKDHVRALLMDIFIPGPCIHDDVLPRAMVLAVHNLTQVERSCAVFLGDLHDHVLAFTVVKLLDVASANRDFFFVVDQERQGFPPAIRRQLVHPVIAVKRNNMRPEWGPDVLELPSSLDEVESTVGALLGWWLLSSTRTVECAH